jgi:hypothetical protein
MDSSKHIHPSTAGLAAFIGGMARVWYFSPSHDLLAIELRQGGRTEYLVLTGCSHVSLPITWSNVAAKLEVDPENRIAPVSLVDRGVRVACEGAVLQTKDPMKLT